MDSSESPTYGEQEGSAYNGHFACTCYHPLFVFNQFGDVERCVLRPGNVHSADGWRAVLEPVIARYRGKREAPLFPGRCGLRQSRDLRVPRSREDRLRDPAAGQPGPAGQDRPLAQAPGRATAARGAAVLRQLQLSGAELEQAAPRRRQGRMASGRAVPARRLHRHQPGALCRGHRRLLQPARHVRAVHQRRQERDQMDPAVMPDLRRQRRASSAPCAGLQSRQLHADAGDAEDGRTVVADQPAREADQDRREGRQPRPLRHLPDGRGRGAAADVRRNPVADRGTAAAPPAPA